MKIEQLQKPGKYDELHIPSPHKDFDISKRSIETKCYSKHDDGTELWKAYRNQPLEQVRAYSHQAKDGPKSETIKEQDKKIKELMANIKEFFLLSHSLSLGLNTA